MILPWVRLCSWFWATFGCTVLKMIWKETPMDPNNRPKENVFPCGQCRQNVNASDTAICCDRCGYWFHELCLSTDIKTLMSSEENFWLCGCSKKAPNQAKIFYRYVDDTLRTVKVTDVKRLLDKANALHRNLEFTIKEGKKAPFLDMLIQRRRDNTLRSGWYTKHGPNDGLPQSCPSEIQANCSGRDSA